MAQIDPPAKVASNDLLGTNASLSEQLRFLATAASPITGMVMLEAAADIDSLRAALALAAPALELGCDALRNEAEAYHIAMAGYRPKRHKLMDDDYKQAATAWQAAVAALGPNAQVSGAGTASA